MPHFPIDSHIPDLCRAFIAHRDIVLSAPPGAGKTTRVPLALLDQPWMNGRRIIMLEPRRLAARSAAFHMASLLGETVGQTVGYRTRMQTRVGNATRLEVVTDGILTRMLQNDPALTPYNLVIFDEYHERSLQADLGLALCLQTQEVLRNELRILVMSATLDCHAVSALLSHAPIITCEGRSFPVKTHYIGKSHNARIETSLVTCIKQALKRDNGNLLVFLPGAREIRHVQRMLHSTHLGDDVMITPLFGNLSEAAQDQAIQLPPPGTRKVVLATSIAETSLTIEGIRVVVDSGLMRIPRFDPQSGLTRLDTIKVSRDSADQRRGRAGRLESGVCYRLWTAIEHQRLLPRTAPEILEADLSPVALELAAWGITNPQSLGWLDPPPARGFATAQALLQQLGAVDGDYHITAHGRYMVALPLHPRLAHMVLRAQELGTGILACDIAAILNERDFLVTAMGRPSADLRLRLDALCSPQTLRTGVTIDRARYQRVQLVAKQLKRQLHLSQNKQNDVAHFNETGLLLAFAYPDRIAGRQTDRVASYRLANGKIAAFLESDPLSMEPYVAIAELDGTKPLARILLAAPVKRTELEASCPELFHDVDFIEWDHRQSAVQARRQRRLGELIVEDTSLQTPTPGHVTSALLQGIRQTGLACLPWTKELRNWQARVIYVRRMAGKDSNWPDVSDNQLLKTLEYWLAPFLDGMFRLTELRRLRLSVALHTLLTWEQHQELEQQAPSHLVVPTGSRIGLDYCSQDVPILAVRLQELFGLRETPKLAHGKGAVILQLLSPAQRPIQVTQDLASFWENGYQEVKKELKGRYPKHEWPDDPLQAQPTRRTKPRN